MEVTYNWARAQFEDAGCSLTETQFQQLDLYLHLLTETNRRINLTAITQPVEIWQKHFLDSAVLLQKIELRDGTTCLDVGTGAGFPGMVMAILRPGISIILLDSLQKRVDFLQAAAERLGLQNVICVHSRAELAAREEMYREQFDFVTARAVASLPVLTEYCMPFLRVGGRFAAMKGPQEHGADAMHALEEMGGRLAEVMAYTIEQVGQWQLIIGEKVRQTPAAYPRRGDKIRKSPL